MVYVAAELTSEPVVMGVESGELAEAIWVSLTEADEVMEDMAVAVRQHLQRVLRGTST